MRKIVSVFIIIIGIIFIAVSIILLNNNGSSSNKKEDVNNKIICRIDLRSYTMINTIDLINDKPITYNRLVITDYSHYVDESFAALCYNNKDKIVDVSVTKNYCKGKKYYDEYIVYYSKMDDYSFYRKIYKDQLKYVREDGTFDKDMFIKEFEEKDYKCESK